MNYSTPASPYPESKQVLDFLHQHILHMLGQLKFHFHQFVLIEVPEDLIFFDLRGDQFAHVLLLDLFD